MANTDPGLAVLFHSLGLDHNGRGQSYRSYFCAGPGHSDYETCTALVAQGHMVRRAGSAISGGDDVFYVTELGKQHAADHAAPPPKLTRSQRRYADYLAADSGVSFREWLIAEGRRRG